MNIKTNKSGFTLLEVIIVIIIVGVLASLALPRFFSTVEYSKATEALRALSTVRQSVERCYLAASGSYVTCDTFAQIDVEDPGAAPGARFAYTFNAGTADAVRMTATRNAADGGDGVSTVFIAIDNTATPPVTKGGTGKYSSIK